ncbi:MAG: glycosyltransferase [Acidobacteria bacterium]|nr:glycosyltransferase [Acidobacteriota bacterium]
MATNLYICYFGVQEPLVQTQVLPYLREIQKDGIEVSLLTFEPARKVGKAVNRKERKRELEAIRQELAAEGISWDWLTYHKRLSVLATAYDILCGSVFVWNRLRKKHIDVLHGRVHIPVLMAAIARKCSRQKPKLLFDIRGFFPEEYTDAGRWAENGLIFRSAKRVEKWLLRVSDGFVVLTEKAREILFPESLEGGWEAQGRPVEVIPCCVDIDRIGSADEGRRTEMRERLGIGDRRVIAYVGSFGGWYMTDEMLEFFQAAHKADPTVFAMILTQREPEKIAENLKKRGFADDDLIVASVAPGEIAGYLAAADLAISFIKACYSKQSSSPTKIAEYLAAGLPIISNGGVGDLDELITGERVGTILNGFSEADYLDAVAQIDALMLDSGLAAHCKSVARKRFDLASVAGERYRRVYRRLLGVENARK